MKTKGTPFSLELDGRIDKFKAELAERMLPNELRRQAQDEHHSLSMLIDMLKRDHADIVARAQLSDVTIRRVLNQLGVKCDNAAYLKLPQAVKLRYKYPAGTSLDVIEAEQRARSRRGFDTMLEARREQQHYQPKNHVEHWLTQGLSPEDADREAATQRKRKSPYSIEFVNYADMSVDDRKLAIGRLAALRGVKGLEAMSRCVSSLEKRVSAALSHAGVEFDVQKIIGCSRAFRRVHPNANHVYAYDLYVPSRRLLIECNGTYWHADARVYRAHDRMNFPGASLTAEQVWARDAVKIAAAADHGYRVEVAWELDVTQPGWLESFIEKKIKHV